MTSILSTPSAQLLKSYGKKKQIAFLLLLYERMFPQLQSFRLREGLNLSEFVRTREEFWRYLQFEDQTVRWHEIRQLLIDLVPDADDFGSHEAALAMDTSLVAIEMSALMYEDQSPDILQITDYALNSIYSCVRKELNLTFYDISLKEYLEKCINEHRLMIRERRVEEEDLLIIDSLKDGYWGETELTLLRYRVKSQRPLLD